VSSEIRLSIVIPAFNEEGRLPATLARIAAYVAGRPELVPAEVIVVDDGSADGTASVAGRVPVPVGLSFRTVRLGRNRGKGAAVKAGLEASTGAWVLISDADLATPIEELGTLMASSAAVVVGSRGVKRELIVRRQPLPRETLGRLFNVGLHVLGLTALRDTQCGFKLLEGRLARRLAAELRLDGFAFDVELLARARRHGATIAEVPVRWYHVESSRVRPLRHGVQMLRDALRIRWWLWTDR
jgi:dolichyl-phosphate beta-glucosyltransferase